MSTGGTREKKSENPLGKFYAFLEMCPPQNRNFVFYITALQGKISGSTPVYEQLLISCREKCFMSNRICSPAL